MYHAQMGSRGVTQATLEDVRALVADVMPRRARKHAKEGHLHDQANMIGAWSVLDAFIPKTFSSVARDWETAVSGTGTRELFPNRLTTDTGGATGAARISPVINDAAVTRGSQNDVINWSKRILVKARFVVAL